LNAVLQQHSIVWGRPAAPQSFSASWLQADLFRFDFRNSPVTGHCWRR